MVGSCIYQCPAVPHPHKCHSIPQQSQEYRLSGHWVYKANSNKVAEGKEDRWCMPHMSKYTHSHSRHIYI